MVSSIKADYIEDVYEDSLRVIKENPMTVAGVTLVSLVGVSVVTGGTTLGLTAPVITSTLATLGGGAMLTGLGTIASVSGVIGYWLGTDNVEVNSTTKLKELKWN